jgi:hypothetical protein
MEAGSGLLPKKLILKKYESGADAQLSKGVRQYSQALGAIDAATHFNRNLDRDRETPCANQSSRKIQRRPPVSASPWPTDLVSPSSCRCGSYEVPHPHCYLT